MILEFWLYQHLFSILYFVIVFLFTGHILRQRKPPSATLAWFLFVLFLPYVGLPFYVLFGSRKYKSRKPQLYPPTSVEKLTAADLLQRTLMAGGCAPPGSNEQIVFLSDGVVAFKTLSELIASAQKSIAVETYIFSNDEVGNLILDQLQAALARGVRVQVLLDSFGARLPGHPSFQEFKRQGGEVAMFMPLLHRPFGGRANLRNHRKLILVDGEIAMLGGMNLANEYMGPAPDDARWVDLAVTIRGDAVYELQRIFELDWAFATHHEPSAPAPPAFHVLEPKHLAQVITSGPDVQADPIYEGLLTLIYGAKERIWIATPYFVPDESLSKALELAARRGVDVRLLIPRRSNHILADLGRGTYVRQVARAGSKIFFFPKMLHAKMTLIDLKYALIGSANMDGRSLLLNYELGLSLYASEDVLACEHWFKPLLGQSCEGLPAAHWYDPWVEGLARMLGPLL